MENNFEKFIGAYQKASPNIQQLIDSEAIGEFAEALVTQYSLLRDAKRTLLITVSNRVLGIISEGEMIASLQGLKLSPEVGADLTAKITAFVQNKAAATIQTAIPTPITPVLSIQKPTTLAEQAKATATIPIPSVQPNPGVPTIRTMAGDMAKTQTSKETVYSSTQEAILREGWSTPKPSDPK